MKGFGFSNCKSFGDRLCRVAPLRKVNLIIGQNNVGKSNIVNFLNEQLTWFAGRANAGRGLSGRAESPYKQLDTLKVLMSTFQCSI